MANFNLNQGSGNKRPPGNTSQIRLNSGNKQKPAPKPEPEPVVEEVQQPVVPQFDIGAPAVELQQKIENTPTPQPSYEPSYEEEEDKDEDEELEPRKGKKGKKKKKPTKRSSKSNNKKRENDEPLDADKAYSRYRMRKILVLVFFIVAVIALIFFGVYNTFFKHTLTAQEAATYTNKSNGQTAVQQWDSGVEGYLQRNLYTLMRAKFDTTNSVGKEFTVANIAVERNQQLSSSLIVSFFSADVTVNGETARTFMMLPLSVKDGMFNLAGELEFSTWEPYSADSVTVVENEKLDFPEDAGKDKEAANDIKPTLQNLFELGYNLDQDVSDIYKGDRKLEFAGKFIEISSVDFYDQPNELGYNVYVKYIVQLESGVAYTNSAYMQVEKNSSGSYIIKNIL